MLKFGDYDAYEAFDINKKKVSEEDESFGKIVFGYKRRYS